MKERIDSVYSSISNQLVTQGQKKKQPTNLLHKQTKWLPKPPSSRKRQQQPFRTDVTQEVGALMQRTGKTLPDRLSQVSKYTLGLE